ncbi:MAG TPA: PilZ domain-containing protein [Candidatus Sulfotelmatobacter sp.]
MFPRLNSRQDRRLQKRQLLNTSVRVITKLGAMDALGINISDGGMGLFTIANLPVGSHIEVEFRTADGPTAFTRVAATVRHRALYLYGIAFCPPSGATGLGAEDSTTSDSPSSLLPS